MGLSPRDVDGMSLWQFAACVDGWNRAQAGDGADVEPLSVEDFEMMLEQT